jgi:hypothetical protein
MSDISRFGGGGRLGMMGTAPGDGGASEAYRRSVGGGARFEEDEAWRPANSQTAQQYLSISWHTVQCCTAQYSVLGSPANSF